MLKCILSVCFVWSSLSCFSQSDSLTITTWNLEHLGSDGRGFPEHVSEGFTTRTASSMRKIAQLINNELELDIVCLQKKLPYRVSNSVKRIVINWIFWCKN